MCLKRGLTLSRKKKREGEASMPASSAGLFQFFGEKTDSIVKIRPELVVLLTAMLMVSVVLAHILLKGAV